MLGSWFTFRDYSSGFVVDYKCLFKGYIVKGDFYQDEIKWKYLTYLPEGKWEYFYKTSWSVSTIQLSCINFVQTENKIWKAGYNICEINNGGSHASLLGMYLVHGLKKDKYDNCTLSNIFMQNYIPWQ